MKPALTKIEQRRRKMVALYARTHGPAPDRYRATARWWRLHAEETKTPDQCREHADAQDRLYADMVARPSHYRRKPTNFTDYQWSQR